MRRRRSRRNPGDGLTAALAIGLFGSLAAFVLVFAKKPAPAPAPASPAPDPFGKLPSFPIPPIPGVPPPGVLDG